MATGGALRAPSSINGLDHFYLAFPLPIGLTDPSKPRFGHSLFFHVYLCFLASEGGANLVASFLMLVLFFF